MTLGETIKWLQKRLGINLAESRMLDVHRIYELTKDTGNHVSIPELQTVAGLLDINESDLIPDSPLVLQLSAPNPDLLAFIKNQPFEHMDHAASLTPYRMLTALETAFGANSKDIRVCTKYIPPMPVTSHLKGDTAMAYLGQLATFTYIRATAKHTLPACEYIASNRMDTDIWKAVRLTKENPVVYGPYFRHMASLYVLYEHIGLEPGMDFNEVSARLNKKE